MLIEVSARYNYLTSWSLAGRGTLAFSFRVLLFDRSQLKWCGRGRRRWWGMEWGLWKETTWGVKVRCKSGIVSLFCLWVTVGEQNVDNCTVKRQTQQHWRTKIQSQTTNLTELKDKDFESNDKLSRAEGQSITLKRWTLQNWRTKFYSQTTNLTELKDKDLESNNKTELKYKDLELNHKTELKYKDLESNNKTELKYKDLELNHKTELKYKDLELNHKTELKDKDLESNNKTAEVQRFNVNKTELKYKALQSNNKTVEGQRFRVKEQNRVEGQSVIIKQQNRAKRQSVTVKQQNRAKRQRFRDKQQTQQSWWTKSIMVEEPTDLAAVHAVFDGFLQQPVVLFSWRVRSFLQKMITDLTVWSSPGSLLSPGNAVSHSHGAGSRIDW